MANPIFRGDARGVAQVDTYQITVAGAAGTIWTITINNKFEKYTVISGDTVQTVAAAIAALLAASSQPEFREIAWTVSTTASDTVVATGSANGDPFTVTSFVNNGAGTQTHTAVTVPTGPNWWSEPTNWSTGAIPVSTDNVYLQDCTTDIKYGLGQGAVTLATLNIAGSYTGKIGLPNFTGPNGYYEYRAKELAISATVCNIGYGAGSSSGMIRINLGANACTLTVSNLASPAVTGYPALLIQGSHASNVAYFYKGRIGMAFFALDTANFPIINVGSIDNPNSDVNLYVGVGASTITTLNQIGGDVTVNCSVTNWTKTAGKSTILLTATVTTLIADGKGAFHWDSSGTISTATFRNGAQLDNTRDDRAKTLTNSTFIAGGYFTFAFKNVTFTNPAMVDSQSLPLCSYGNGQFHLTLAA